MDHKIIPSIICFAALGALSGSITGSSKKECAITFGIFGVVNHALTHLGERVNPKGQFVITKVIKPLIDSAVCGFLYSIFTGYLRIECIKTMIIFQGALILSEGICTVLTPTTWRALHLLKMNCVHDCVASIGLRTLLQRQRILHPYMKVITTIYPYAAVIQLIFFECILQFSKTKISNLYFC